MRPPHRLFALLALAVLLSALVGLSTVVTMQATSPPLDGASHRRRVCAATRADWAAQIRADLRPFTHAGITRSLLDEAVRCVNRSTETGFLVSIRRNQIFAREIIGRSRRRPQIAFLHLFARTVACFRVPNVDFVVRDGDTPMSGGGQCPRGLPIFGYSKEPAKHDDVLIPCPWQFNEANWPWAFRRTPLPAWEDRIARAVFRGGAPDARLASARHTQLAREKT